MTPAAAAGRETYSWSAAICFEGGFGLRGTRAFWMAEPGDCPVTVSALTACRRQQAMLVCYLAFPETPECAVTRCPIPSPTDASMPDGA